MDKAMHELELRNAELLAAISHELRSPLTAIKGYAEMLLRYEQHVSLEERKEFIQAISVASDRMGVVVERLLQMLQLETNAAVVKYEAIDMAHLIDEAISAIEQRFNLVPIESLVEVETQRLSPFMFNRDSIQKDVIIQADRQLCRAVLDHLLENALIYSPAGGNIEMSLREIDTSEQGNSLFLLAEQLKQIDQYEPLFAAQRACTPIIEIAIRDHGTGISPEHLEHIFDRFYRVDTRLTREVNGLGVGLAICKRIVELHAGIIWAESQPGQGSVFHVLVPMYPIQTAQI